MSISGDRAPAGATIGGLDIRAVGLDEGLRGHLLPYRVDLQRERLSKADVAHLRGQPGKGVEQADAHSEIAGRGLTDLVEGTPRKTGQAQGRPDDPDGVSGPEAGARVIEEGGEGAQLVAEPVHAGEAREGVVHGRAEGAECDLHELRDAELHILLEGAMPPDQNLALDGGAHHGPGCGREHMGQRSTFHHELTRAMEELHRRVGSIGRGEKPLKPDFLDEAGDG